MICLQTFVFQLIRTPLTSMFLSLQLLLRRGDSRSSVFSPDLFLQAPESLFWFVSWGCLLRDIPLDTPHINYVQRERESLYVFSWTFTTSSSRVPFSVTVISVLVISDNYVVLVIHFVSLFAPLIIPPCGWHLMCHLHLPYPLHSLPLFQTL